VTLQEQLDSLLEAVAFDSTGTKIGAVRQVYVDNSTGKATFATVATGVFSADAIVPLHGARLLDGEVHVDHTKQVVKDSPRQDHSEDALTPAQEAELLEHYGLEAPRVRSEKAADAASSAEKEKAPSEKAKSEKAPSEKNRSEKASPAKAETATSTAATTPTKNTAAATGTDKTTSAGKSTPAETAKTGTKDSSRPTGSSRIDTSAPRAN